MSLLAPTPLGSIGHRGHRIGLFISHKVSNAKQSVSSINVRCAVKAQMTTLGIVVSCAVWSKLSGESGPQDQWAVVSEMAKKKSMTKAQILVQWSLQKGYICVPRSGCAIGENSYGGVNVSCGGCVLTKEEMDVLDGLDI
eukprot:15366378-Ditylum_brightwellii.AAC.2